MILRQRGQEGLQGDTLIPKRNERGDNNAYALLSSLSEGLRHIAVGDLPDPAMLKDVRKVLGNQVFKLQGLALQIRSQVLPHSLLNVPS